MHAAETHACGGWWADQRAPKTGVDDGGGEISPSGVLIPSLHQLTQPSSWLTFGLSLVLFLAVLEGVLQRGSAPESACAAVPTTTCSYRQPTLKPWEGRIGALGLGWRKDMTHYHIPGREMATLERVGCLAF